MFRCAVFDLDGTLLNTIDTIAYFCNETLKHFGYPEIETDLYKIFVGEGARLLVERMFHHRGCENEKIIDEAYEYYVKLYDSEPLYKTTVYSGIYELIDSLKEKNIRTAVLSNKPDSAVKAVVKHFFKDSFDPVFGQRDNFPKKPDPSVLLGILREFGIKPEECLYFGDTKTDMQTGKNAGVYTVGVLWGFRDKEELVEFNADEIIEKPSDILKNIF